MEAILACHPARSTEWLDCHPKWCEDYELWRIRSGPIWTRSTERSFLMEKNRWVIHGRLLTSRTCTNKVTKRATRPSLCEKNCAVKKTVTWFLTKCDSGKKRKKERKKEGKSYCQEGFMKKALWSWKPGIRNSNRKLKKICGGFKVKKKLIRKQNLTWRSCSKSITEMPTKRHAFRTPSSMKTAIPHGNKHTKQEHHPCKRQQLVGHWGKIAAEQGAYTILHVRQDGIIRRERFSRRCSSFRCVEVSNSRRTLELFLPQQTPDQLLVVSNRRPVLHLTPQVDDELIRNIEWGGNTFPGANISKHDGDYRERLRRETMADEVCLQECPVAVVDSRTALLLHSGPCLVVLRCTHTDDERRHGDVVFNPLRWVSADFRLFILVDYTLDVGMAKPVCQVDTLNVMAFWACPGVADVHTHTCVERWSITSVQAAKKENQQLILWHKRTSTVLWNTYKPFSRVSHW